MPRKKRKEKEKAKTPVGAFELIGLPKPPETKIVRLDEINVDGHYQRIPNLQRIEKWCKCFDPIMCNVLILNRRCGGHIYIMDGNHRRLLLQKMGYTKWKAYLTEGLDSKQEAEKYTGLNSDRKNANSAERFKARLWYEEPVAVTIRDTCKICGFQIILEKISHRNGREIHAVGALDKIYRQSNQPGLHHVLEVLAECWSEDEAGATDAIALKGMHYVLSHKVWKEKMDLHHLIKRLQAVPVSRLIRAARGFLDTHMGDVVALFADAVICENNKKLRKGSKLWLPPRHFGEKAD